MIGGDRLVAVFIKIAISATGKLIAVVNPSNHWDACVAELPCEK